MSAAPPNPFYLIPPTLFTPAFQTSNADGSIGNGSFKGVYWVVGQVMTVCYFLFWGNTSAGTGAVLLSLPANWDPATNMDTDNMFTEGPFKLMPGVYGQAVGATNTSLPGGVIAGGGLLALSPSLPAAPGNLGAGDSAQWRVDIPLKDNLPRS